MVDILRKIKRIKNELEDISAEHKSAEKEKEKIERILISLGVDNPDLDSIDEEIERVERKIKSIISKIENTIEDVEKILRGRNVTD